MLRFVCLYIFFFLQNTHFSLMAFLGVSNLRFDKKMFQERNIFGMWQTNLKKNRTFKCVSYKLHVLFINHYGEDILLGQSKPVQFTLLVLYICYSYTLMRKYRRNSALQAFIFQNIFIEDIFRSIKDSVRSMSLA